MERQRILRACYSFLVPIARFLLRSGISFREFADISRVAFVTVASEDYGLRGRPTNASRVAAMTGIARKDVTKVRSLGYDYLQDPRVQLSPLADVLQYWCTNEAYLDENRQPRTIPIVGPCPSFEHLAHMAGGDVPAGALRVELVRAGTIEEVHGKLLKVLRREIVPKDIDERLFTSLAFSLKALATTIAFNTKPGRQSPGRIERFVESGPLTEESRSILYHIVRQRVVEFTEEIDDLFSEVDKASGGERIGVGVYYHEDHEPE